MGTWRIKKKEYKKLSEFRILKKNELKKGDVYFWKCPYRKIITNELLYDNYTLHYNINYQIREGLIWVKK
tara:strand:+ start:269 stop:478 length:210 start_codon:yes stop_codon:yes gene_type:complete